MMKSNKIKDITAYLDDLFPNPICELNFNKDYELLIAVMLSAQTTDKKVNKVTPILFDRYKTLEDLSKANIDIVKEIIKSIGTYNRKSQYIIDIAKKLTDDGYDYVPNNREYLESLPGVGRKSTNVILSVIYNVPAIAVDTHVERVSKRLSLVDKNDTVLEVEKKLMKKFPKKEWSLRHHQLVLFGRYHCKAIKPNCYSCMIKERCSYYKNKL